MARAAAIFCLALALLPPAYASAGESPSQAREQMRSRLVKLSARYDSITEGLSRIRANIKKLGNDIQTGRKRGKALAAEHKQLNAMQARAAKELTEVSAGLQAGRKQYGKRLRVLYLNGHDASLALWAKAGSFQDALTRSQALTRILAADHYQLAALLKKRNRLQALKQDLAYRKIRLGRLESRISQNRSRNQLRLDEHKRQEKELARKKSLLNQTINALREAQARLARTFALGEPRAQGEQGRPTGVTAARGWLSPPVEGRVLGRSGPGGRGVRLAARPGSAVRSPWSAVVVYSGYLSGFGKVLVLDHGERVHTVLAHLGALSVEAGAKLQAGGVVAAVGKEGTLYLEVRRGARPVNPLNWLKLRP